MNKLLLTFFIPEIGLEFDAYIPINKKVGTIKKYLINMINDMTENNYDATVESMKFVDHETGKEYENNLYIKETGIKNGTKLIIL